MKDFFEMNFFEMVGVVVGAWAAVLCVIFLVVTLCGSKSCKDYQEITKRATVFRTFGGCFVETKSGWLTKDEYKQVIIAKEGLAK